MSLKNMSTKEQKNQNSLENKTENDAKNDAKNNADKNKILESTLQQMPRVKMIADLKKMISEIKEENLPLVYCLIQEELSKKSSKK